MKNRLIYILIGLMLVSLIGIIIVQSIWISDAISEREQQFASHVNDAMNHVNDEIGQDEAVMFLERTFGGMDSLWENIVETDNNQLEEHIVFSREDDGQENTVKIQYSISDSVHIINTETHSNGEHSRAFTRSHPHHSSSDRMHRIELKLDQLDSVLENHEILEDIEEHRREDVNAVVQHFTFEKMLSGDLKDRISLSELEEKLKNGLTKEGIAPEVDLAVYNAASKEYEEGFVSAGFDTTNAEKAFRKSLFPKDRVHRSSLELVAQIDSQGDFVWKKVRVMVSISVLFTLLILVCFGYALYFIFKQKKISQIKNDFINNMTHELKTPLASISLAASSIKHPQVISNQAEIEHFVDIIESEKERMNGHIEKVLDIASLDKGELHLNMDANDLLEIIQTSLTNVDLSLSESNGSSSLQTTLSIAPIQCDAFHLTNVFTNILDNSIKYRKNDLKVRIEVEENGAQYIIKIGDNGIGMSAKAQKLAFDKFYREESGDIHNRKGFGLGLSYVKSIVEAHRGTVQLTSELNVGTTIIIQIPKK